MLTLLGKKYDIEDYWNMTRKKDKESKEAFTIWSRLEKILKDKKIENYTVTSNTPGSVVPEFLYYAIIKNVDDNH